MIDRTSMLEKFPESYRADIAQAVAILKEGGCSEVYVFGSVAEDRTRAGSDIDLAVRGCPPERFFPLLGRLLMTLKHPVDLVNLDHASRLNDFLQNHKLLVHIEGDVVQRGQVLYAQKIRAVVDKAENKGKMLVIHVETGEWEMDVDDMIAAKRAKARFGNAPLFSMRIGYPAAYRIGGGFLWPGA